MADSELFIFLEPGNFFPNQFPIIAPYGDRDSAQTIDHSVFNPFAQQTSPILEQSVMFYVYILRSIQNPSQTYIGMTSDLRRRLQDHNAKRSAYASNFAPWRIQMYLAFSEKDKAFEFERYLKKGGGWRFAQRRLM